ncbi:Cache 3/Cache 2 fusion domain-containing protein [Maridesulfovibrio bastinii]|uniref:Cache 3/Cache 2 fusion domain-containing protein n=1 Tax=Maridesulfovibrio bastinii TaxID=47157 RepID=UPI0004839690|nr:Cache 3/Cache 2 fusion domain-containing protein [Maridesulfovibrio bastinii]
MFKQISFQTKLMVGSIGVILATVIAMTSLNLLEVDRSLNQLGKTSMHSITDGVVAMMEMQNGLLLDKVKADLDILDKRLFGLGFPSLNKRKMIPETITNQITKQTESTSIPTMTFGGIPINKTFDLVDSVKETVGGTATIFQLLPGKLLRVSTNVKKNDGSRAVDTYIPDSSPVYKSIIADKTFYGMAYVVNAWYITAYKPIKSLRGKIVGAIYVGRRILAPEFIKSVSSSNVGGKGYGFIFNEKGDVLLHPDKDKEINISKMDFWPEFSRTKNGLVSYKENGLDMVAYVQEYKTWGWSFAFTMEKSEMAHGVDAAIFKMNIIIAIVAVILAVLVMLFLMKVTSKPLNQLSSFTDSISKGHYNASLDYTVNDVIGTTITAVKSMVADLKEKLGFSEGLLKGMTIPSIVVDLDENITFTNSQQLVLAGKSGDSEDFKGRPLTDLITNPLIFETIRKCVHSGENLIDVEIEGKNTAGESYYAIIDAAPLRNLDGDMIGAFVMMNDVTKIKENEQAVLAQHNKISEAAVEAEAISDQLSSASEQLSAQVEQSRNGAEMQLQRATETSTAMEEMTATVMEVARNAGEAAENAQHTRGKALDGQKLVVDAVNSIKELEENSHKLRSSMEELGSQTEAIGHVMNVITDIADQTNLLALNAAIEAARAGDAGRGFAVVADEVRKLAEKTMEATKEVGESITNIQNSTQLNIEATQEATRFVGKSTELANMSGEALDEIVKMIEATTDQVQSIATAAEQQSATSEEINRATEEINEISSETVRSTEESAQAIRELSKLALSIKELIKNMQS